MAGISKAVCGISAAVGIEVVVFDTADAADKKDIAKIDVVDSGVGSNVNRAGVRRGLEENPVAGLLSPNMYLREY